MRPSVIITSFNHGSHLAAAIDSALAQSVPCEVVVVDDGSTDGSRAILAGYRDRITCILKANGGQASALNAGFEAMTGDVAILLDADDVMLPTRAERVLAELGRGDEPGWVRHAMAKIDEAGSRLPGGYAYRSTPHRPQLDVVRRGRTPGVTSVLALSRAMIDRMGEIPLGYTGYADWYILVFLALSAPGVHLPEILTERRIHPGRHFTAHSVLDMDRGRYHLALRERISRDGATIGAAVGRQDIASGSTWWQRKAAYEAAKERGEPKRLGLWSSMLRSMWNAPLPVRTRMAVIARSSITSCVPRPWYPAVWWMTNEGRLHRRSLAG